MRASHRLSATSLLRPLTCWTNCACSSSGSMPASSRASKGAFQKMPVPSIAAAVTRWPASHRVSASSPSGKALNCRVAHSTPPPGWHSRTEAVTCILWTSSPPARACTTCSSSGCSSALPPTGIVMLYPPCSGSGQNWPVGNPSARGPGLDLLCVLGRGPERYGARKGAAASV